MAEQQNYSYKKCELCGEPILVSDEVGEFVTEDGEHVLAHAQCGLDRNLQLA